MLAKLITVVVFATAVGAVLLGLRQQRLQIMHEMAAMHAQINQNRQTMWDLQVRIAERMQPEALHAAIARTDLELEPIRLTPQVPLPNLLAPTPMVPGIPQIPGFPAISSPDPGQHLRPLGMPEPSEMASDREGYDG